MCRNLYRQKAPSTEALSGARVRGLMLKAYRYTLLVVWLGNGIDTYAPLGLQEEQPGFRGAGGPSPAARQYKVTAEIHTSQFQQSNQSWTMICLTLSCPSYICHVYRTSVISIVRLSSPAHSNGEYRVVFPRPQ